MHKVYLPLVIAVVMIMGFSNEAKADGVQLTLANTTYDLGSGMFTITGSFTNSGTATFIANRWDMVFSSNLPLEVRAVPFSELSNYTQPVPGMTTSAVLPLLDVIAIGPIAPGTYLGSLTFTGVAGSDLNVTTPAVQFTVNVPAAVPEPTTVLLFSSGLMAIGAAIRRRRRAI